jgi:hypothetical protein
VWFYSATRCEVRLRQLVCRALSTSAKQRAQRLGDAGQA